MAVEKGFQLLRKEVMEWERVRGGWKENLKPCSHVTSTATSDCVQTQRLHFQKRDDKDQRKSRRGC